MIDGLSLALVALGSFAAGAIAVRLIFYFTSPRDTRETIKSEMLENRTVALQQEVNSLRADIGGMEALLGSKEKQVDELQRQALHLEDLFHREEEKNRTILSQKKSSEIRTGHIAETLAPFLMDEHDPKRLRWLGQPVDYIAFDPDGITFIEVKSGKSHLSHNQKRIKQLVLERKVYWKEFRIKGRKRKNGNKR